MARLFFILFICFFFSCSEPSAGAVESQDVSRAETQQMIDELKAISQDRSDPEMWHLNADKARAYEKASAETQDVGQQISLRYKAAYEWLNAGDYNRAIQLLGTIDKFVTERNVNLPPQVAISLKQALGIAYLRKGEIENCIKHHNEYSCILPIVKDGKHIEQDGAASAKKIFTELSEVYPNDPQIHWLKMISEMALGEYAGTGDAPAAVSLPAMASDIDYPRFRDKAMGLGLGVNDIAGGVVIDDFNGDHYLDIICSSYGLDDQLRYFENDRSGGFVDRTMAAGLDGMLSGLNLVQADYDNDGHLDVLVLRGAWLGKYGNHPNSLLKNLGDGRFVDVTRSAGLYSKYPSQTASWADFDADGYIDLFIGNEHSSAIDAPCQLYHNQGDGTFIELASAKGISVNDFIKACSWGDVNNDGYADLYLSSVVGDNYLFVNGGPTKDFKFQNVAGALGVQEPKLSFPCWFFDFNQDGWQDIFVSGFDFSQFESAAGQVAKDFLGLETQAELPRLYINDGNGGFTERSEAVGIDKVVYTMGCNFGDINNDGFPDAYLGTGTPDFKALIPNKFFLNDGGKKYLDITSSAGLGHLQKGHGIAFGDLDLDGDQDIYHVLGGSYDGDNFMNALFENPGNDGNWIRLKLIGNKANRSAIGARLKIVASNSSGQSKIFFNRVSSGGSFGANTLWVEQGLGQYSMIENIEVTWPGGAKSSYSNLESSAHYIINQSKTEVQKLSLSAIEFTESSHHHHGH